MEIVRFEEEDRTGILGAISSTLGRYEIGIESMMQSTHAKNADETVPLVFIFYETNREVLDEAMEELKNRSFVKSVDSVIRVEK